MHDTQEGHLIKMGFGQGENILKEIMPELEQKKKRFISL